MAQNILGILAGQAPADEDPLRIRQGGQAFRGLAQADVQNGGPEAAAVFLNAHGPPRRCAPRPPPGLHGPARRLPEPRAPEPAPISQTTWRGPTRSRDSAAARTGFLLISLPSTASSSASRPRCGLRGARRGSAAGCRPAESATGRLGQAQLMPGFVGRAHALENMRREPVHAPVQQMACQHVRGHAGVGEDAERRVLGHGHIQRAQVVPAVQGGGRRPCARAGPGGRRPAAGS